jgi:hypothetical protein
MSNTDGDKAFCGVNRTVNAMIEDAVKRGLVELLPGYRPLPTGLPPTDTFHVVR